MTIGVVRRHRARGWWRAALLLPTTAVAHEPHPITQPVRVAGFRCLPVGVARGDRIVALGAYEGGGQSPVAAVGDGHATGAITISGARQGAPVILVLSAYDPVVWDLRALPSSRVRAVLVFGYHGQAVAGLQRSAIARFSTYRGGDGACGSYGYAYEGGGHLEALDTSVRQALGRGIDSFQGSYTATAFDIDHGPLVRSDLAPVRVGELRSSEPFESGQRAGAAGLDALIADGALRPATQADIHALDAALTRASPTGRLAPVRSRIGLTRTYVVLKAMTVPRGMYGAGSAIFLIPPGVPRPSDRGSHNSYVSLADGSMTGLPLP